MTDDAGIYAHPEDEGLAAERTELAWSRSGVAIMACGVVIAKGLPEISGVPSRPITGGLILVLGLVTWGLGLQSARRRRAEEGGERGVAVWRDLAPIAIGTAAVGLASFLLGFFDPD